MARAKKEAVLTPEERLQAALVPDWERPYKLPENWCWTTIKNVAAVVTGGTPAKNNSDYYGGEFPFFKPADLDAGRHVSEASEYLSDLGKSVSRIIPAQATAVCCIGSIGKCGFLDVEGATNQQINSAIPYFNALYQYFYMNTEFFTNQLRNSASATTIAIVNKTKMESCYYPLAPLAEQQRIVDRIESLFAKLDEAKEKAQAVVDSFETRKAAILHKAFTGELTAKWREEHGVGMEGWRTISFKDVCKKITDGTHHSPINTENGEYMYITAKNIKENGIDLTNITFVSKDVHEEIYSRCDVQYGDVLYIKDGATTGIATVNTIDKPFSLLSSVAVLRPDKKQILAEYMAYNLNSSKTKTMMISSMSGNAITRLTLSKIKAASITICSLDEQEEIVRLIDNLLRKEQQAKKAAEAALDQIDLMKKSILARAFRGELGTNDPSEESAVELLKQII